MATLLGQRLFGLALGCEDLNDHDELRHDELLAACLGRLGAKRRDCAALAGRNTLGRLERSPSGSVTRYHKISHDPAAIERVLVELFLGAKAAAPKQIVLDFADRAGASDIPLHGDQEGKFFHGYYGHYCYLPLYVFCGEHLLAAKRRVVAKAEVLPPTNETSSDPEKPNSGKANPRFVVTSLNAEEHGAQALYEKLYCARGDMETSSP